MATGGFMSYSSEDSDSKLSSVMMANIEALANGESADCNYVNGYAKWKTERPWPWSDEMTFFDCCKERCKGFSPESSCI